MNRVEVLGRSVDVVSIQLLPGWLQVATGVPVIIGVLVACVATFVVAPRQPSSDEHQAISDKLVLFGILLAFAGLISLLITAQIFP